MELLEKHFDTAFAAPNGIEKLRELVLTLAVQGKLVPHYSNDQTASNLLKEIATKKQRLMEEDGLRTSADEYINREEEYIERPLGWEYCRLGNLARFIDYRGRTPKKVNSGIPLITAKNVRFGFINREPYEYITEDDYESWMTRGFPRLGDLLFTTEAPLGHIAVIDTEERFALAQRVICLQLHNPKMSHFLKWIMMSVPFQSQLVDNATGMTARGIKSARLKEIPIPIPPVEEQHRIVAKIDQLMARCDELEKLRAERDRLKITVHRAACDRLLTAPDTATFVKSWQFITQHFSELYSVKENVAELRKAILHLAVMGKLVPQDPNDLPAIVLLKEIERKKKQLIAEKKLKIGKITKDSKKVDRDINLPPSWAWTKGTDLFFITKLAGFEYTKHISLEDAGQVPVIRAQNVRPFLLDIENLKYIDLETSKLLERCALTKQALLVTFIGAGIGDVALFDCDERWHLAPNVAKMEPFLGCENKIDLQYFLYFLNSPIGREEVFKHMKSTAQPSISMGTIRDIDYSIPPLPEQHRIVTKVDQLMTLCDLID